VADPGFLKGRRTMLSLKHEPITGLGLRSRDPAAELKVVVG